MPNELMTWQIMSFYAFLLRYRQAFDDPSTWPEELKANRDSFMRLGIELDVLELDLKLTVGELRTAYEALYGAPEHLALKKFAVVYHVDNFYVRVHKLLENVNATLALAVGLDIESRPIPGSPSLRANLKKALALRRLTAIDACLRQFEEATEIHQARDARNLFVHRYRDEPKWPALGPASRLLEFEDNDETERLIRRELEPSEIDRYANRRAAELDRILELVRALRSRLYLQCLHEAITILSRQPVDVRRRWQWLVETETFFRDMDAV